MFFDPAIAATLKLKERANDAREGEPTSGLAQSLGEKKKRAETMRRERVTFFTFKRQS